MTQALIETTDENGTHYQFRTVGPHTRLRGETMPEYYGENRLPALLGDATLVVNGTNTVNGTKQYILVGSNISSDAVRNVSLNLTVSEGGAIRQMNESGEFTDGGTFAYQYRARLGVETVESPNWVTTAPINTNSTTK